MNEIVRQVRNIRAEMQLPPSEKTELVIVGNPNHWVTVEETGEEIMKAEEPLTISTDLPTDLLDEKLKPLEDETRNTMQRRREKQGAESRTSKKALFRGRYSP